MKSLSVSPIGIVLNGDVDIERGDWSSQRSEIKLIGRSAECLLGLEEYSHLIVIGWLDQIPEELRNRSTAHPAGDERLPLQGALALRGGARPNPLSVSVCRLFAIEGLSVTVEGLDLVDGTPILDLKPYVAFYDARPEATLPRWAAG